jgi:FAD-linked sulfhydryl oxidase
MFQASWDKLKANFNADERCDHASCVEGVHAQSSRLVYPPDRSQIGRANWRYVHARATNFPDVPSEEEQQSEINWIQSFIYTYPCRICARDFVSICGRMPPVVSSARAYQTWWSLAHNEVNKDLSKPLFKFLS